jgi:flagellar hook protein FlgE
VDSADLYNESPGYEHELSGGTLAFDTTGALLDASVGYMTVDFYAATAGQLIELDFGVDITNDGGNGLGGSTSFDGPSTVTALHQDGNPSGTAVDVTIGPRGVATVECSFGGSIEIGSVVLARFPNEDELAVGRDGTFRQTTESGAPAFAPPGYPGRGLIE